MGRSGNRANDYPWSSLFDPIANARALADVQAQGLRAASELVERLARSVDGAESNPPQSQDAAEADGTGDGKSRMSEATRLLDAWVELLRRSAEAFGRTVETRAAATDRTEVDLDAGSASGTLRIEIDETGAARNGPAEVWLHNLTHALIGPLTVHCSELRAPEAGVLPARLTFEPSHLDELPARSNRGVAVAIAIDENVAEQPLQPGTYRGLVQVTGAPKVWLPVEVVVVSDATT